LLLVITLVGCTVTVLLGSDDVKIDQKPTVNDIESPDFRPLSHKVVDEIIRDDSDDWDD